MKTELLIMKGGYMSNRNFTFKDNDLQYWVQTAYPESEWSFVRSKIGERAKVSKSAIALCKRVKNELNIDVFPLIITIAVKGYREDGQCKFMMYGKTAFDQYFFDYPINYYHKKSNRLSVNTDIITCIKGCSRSVPALSRKDNNEFNSRTVHI